MANQSMSMSAPPAVPAVRPLSRKKRRRLEVDAAHPPDPTNKKLYYSETNLDECKAFLNLNNDLYIAMRKQFEAICNELDMDRKKPALEDGRWQAGLDKLVRENMHLSAVMNHLHGNMTNKQMGLDLICADVAKGIRNNKKQITIADANNILGLSPVESKAIRRVLYEMLQADGYTTRAACGPERWGQLRQEWIDQSPILKQLQLEGDPLKLRCIQLLCRDASKRFNDDRLRRDPTIRETRPAYLGPGPGAVKHKVRGRRATLKQTAPEVASQLDIEIEVPASGATFLPPRPTLSANENATPVQQVPFQFGQSHVPGFNVQIDPSLSTPNRYAPAQAFPFESPTQPSRSQPSIPAYFKLSPTSQLVGHHARMWLGKLAAPDMLSLHAAALSKAGAATVRKVQGIVKNGDGTEDTYQIDGDDELAVYLEAAGEKPTFVVTLGGGYA